MSKQANHYDSIYENFGAKVLAQIRTEAFGEDIGQNSWLTVAEYREFLAWLELSPSMHVLDVCCGSGGPAFFLAREIGCRVTGIDQNESGIRDAERMASLQKSSNVAFRVADAGDPLEFENCAFNAIISIDAINHLENRLAVLREFHRVLKPAGRLLFTDPITVTGILRSDEIRTRSQIGHMSFTPRGENEKLLRNAGFVVRRVEDVTANAALTSGRRHGAREKYRAELIPIEGEDVFSSMQCFLAMAHLLSSARRLSRFAFLAEK